MLALAARIRRRRRVQVETEVVVGKNMLLMQMISGGLFEVYDVIVPLPVKPLLRLTGFSLHILTLSAAGEPGKLDRSKCVIHFPLFSLASPLIPF
jgi:hypothetical protein